MNVWIARDEDDSLWLFSSKPEKNKDGGFDIRDENLLNCVDCMELNKDWYPEITHKNSPQKFILNKTISLELINIVIQEVEKFYGSLPDKEEIIERLLKPK